MSLVNTVMNLRVPYDCWEFPDWLHNWQLLRKGSELKVRKYESKEEIEHI
jgi:hypothetical protein